MIYSYIFGIILACVSYLVYNRHANVYQSIVKNPEKRYDYVIIGAGTAGCVLAARLSEDPINKVLLIEAGDHMGYFTRIPLMATAAQLGPDDWSVKTAAQKFSSFGLWGQSQILPRGKGLGGSGQINFLLHGFGLPEDYDRWSDLGFKGWSAGDLKPYFIKAFGTSDSEFDAGNCIDCSESEAPMKLKLINEKDGLMNAFRRASGELKTGSVFRRATATVRNGLRHASLDAYLKPALSRKNLHVLLKTQAISIRFVNKTTSSLYILKNHRELDNVFINKEVILCAGAVNTPQILMLSGIGPAHVLKRLQIKTVVENRYVGRNLHDHMNIPIYVSIKEPISVTLSKVFTVKTVWDYFWSSRGLLSFPPVAGVEYQNKSAIILFSMGSASERLLRDLSNYKQQVYRDTFPFHNNTHKEGFMFLATCTQPASRGSLTLTEPSIKAPVFVDPRYLEEYTDVKCMIQAIRRIENLILTTEFQKIGAQILWPRPERCLAFWNYSSEDQREIMIKRKRTVKLVSGVRVIDASILPSPVSLFPNSVLIGMAEKAADMILNKNN